MIHALVPVKSLVVAKSRLSPLLTIEERQGLVLAMLDDVLATLRAVPAVATTTVVGDDPPVLRVANAAGARVRADGGGGLNDALAQAAFAEKHAGASQVLILFADLPLLRAAELRHFIEQGANGRVVLGASRDGGTNALLTGLAPLLPFRFGAGSLARHQAEALAHNLTPRVVHQPGLAADIDRPDDLLELAEHGGSTESERFVRGLALLERLPVVDQCL